MLPSGAIVDGNSSDAKEARHWSFMQELLIRLGFHLQHARLDVLAICQPDSLIA